MNNTFKREQKYLVIKVKDAKHYLDEDQLEQLAGIADTVEARRKAVGLPGLECVVIESHWPEYESTWQAIEARVTGAKPVQDGPDGWLRAIDEALVVAHIDVANAEDTYEQAKAKLDNLIGLHVDIATDPAVNGGWKLVPVEPTKEMLEAGQTEWLDSAGADPSFDVYRAMLAAAPENKP